MGYHSRMAAMAGDPRFSFKRAFKVPRSLRKLKVGRALGGAFGAAAPFIGGPFGAAFTAAQMAGLAGDPFLGKLLGSLSRGATKLMGKGPISNVIKGAGGLISKIPAPILGGIAAGAGGAVASSALEGLFGGSAPGGARHYRRMNPGNIRALRRSIRRVKSFEKLAKESVRIASTVKMRKRRKR